MPHKEYPRKQQWARLTSILAIETRSKCCNFSNLEFTVKAEDRVAQLIIKKYTKSEIEDIKEDKLGSIEKDEGGFGSTCF